MPDNVKNNADTYGHREIAFTATVGRSYVKLGKVFLQTLIEVLNVCRFHQLYVVKNPLFSNGNGGENASKR